MQKHSLGQRQQNLRDTRACNDYTRHQKARAEMRSRTRGSHGLLGQTASGQRSVESLLALAIEPEYLLQAIDEQTGHHPDDFK